MGIVKRIESMERRVRAKIEDRSTLVSEVNEEEKKVAGNIVGYN